LKEKEEKKRKHADILAEDVRLSKRHCMDGSNHVERVVGEPIPTEFPQSLYNTEICVAVPLPFFLTQNLCSLVDEASTLLAVKSNLHLEKPRVHQENHFFPEGTHSRPWIPRGCQETQGIRAPWSASRYRFLFLISQGQPEVVLGLSWGTLSCP